MPVLVEVAISGIIITGVISSSWLIAQSVLDAVKSHGIIFDHEQTAAAAAPLIVCSSLVRSVSSPQMALPESTPTFNLGTITSSKVRLLGDYRLLNKSIPHQTKFVNLDFHDLHGVDLDFHDLPGAFRTCELDPEPKHLMVLHFNGRYITSWNKPSGKHLMYAGILAVLALQRSMWK